MQNRKDLRQKGHDRRQRKMCRKRLFSDQNIYPALSLRGCPSLGYLKPVSPVPSVNQSPGPSRPVLSFWHGGLNSHSNGGLSWERTPLLSPCSPHVAPASKLSDLLRIFPEVADGNWGGFLLRKCNTSTAHSFGLHFPSFCLYFILILSILLCFFFFFKFFPF